MITKKQLLWLISIAIMTIIISVACNRKPTDAEDFLHVEEAPGQTGEIPQPEKKLLIGTNQDLIQFKGFIFQVGWLYFKRRLFKNHILLFRCEN